MSIYGDKYGISDLPDDFESMIIRHVKDEKDLDDVYKYTANRLAKANRAYFGSFRVIMANSNAVTIREILKALSFSIVALAICSIAFFMYGAKPEYKTES